MRRILATALVSATALVVTLAGGSTPVSACSIVGPELQAPAQVTAGETMTVMGIRFFTIEGELDADCSGDYELVAAAEVAVTAEFETDSGVRVLTHTSSGADEDDDFAIGPVDFAVPHDARSVRLTTSPPSSPLTIDVVGGPPPRPTPTPTQPEPAAPVSAEPSYTG